MFETYVDSRIEKEEVWEELEKAIKASTLVLVVLMKLCILNMVFEWTHWNNGVQQNEEDNVVFIHVFYRIEPSMQKQACSYHATRAKHKKHGKDKI